MDLDDEYLGQVVEWKLWQLHRAATRKIETGGASRDQSRDQRGSEGASGVTIGGASRGASGGESGKAHESESSSSKQRAYDPVRDFE